MEVVENIQVPLQEEAQSGSVRNVLLEIVEDQPKWLKETIEAKKNLIISIMLSKDRHLSDEKKISLMDLRNIGLEQDINVILTSILPMLVLTTYIYFYLIFT